MINQRSKPLIIGFVTDLFFALKIEQILDNLGYDIEWIESSDQVSKNRAQANLQQYAEHLDGPGADLIDLVTNLQPVLILFDLNNNNIPWYRWIALLKSAPATRRVPILAYGPHVDDVSLNSAKGAGADVVLTRGKFIKELDELIQTYARIPDRMAVQKACDQSLSNLAIRGLEEFNRGQYFEAHEYLEEAWNEDQSEARELYRAVLQVAVAYMQIQRGNYNGAVKMFLRMRQWFNVLPDTCRGVNVAQLRKDANEVYSQVIVLGSNQIGRLQRYEFKPVDYALK